MCCSLFFNFLVAHSLGYTSTGFRSSLDTRLDLSLSNCICCASNCIVCNGMSTLWDNGHFADRECVWAEAKGSARGHKQFKLLATAQILQARELCCGTFNSVKQQQHLQQGWSHQPTVKHMAPRRLSKPLTVFQHKHIFACGVLDSGTRSLALVPQRLDLLSFRANCKAYLFSKAFPEEAQWRVWWGRL